MQFTYTPEGAEPTHWPFEPRKMLNAEAEAIERKTGLPFAEWVELVQQGHMGATHALLWVLLKRERPTLKYDEVVFSYSEVGLTYTDDETRRMLADLDERAKGPEGITEFEADIAERLRASLTESDPDADDEAADDDGQPGPAGESDPKDD